MVMTVEELLKQYRYIWIKSVNDSIEYDYCSGTYIVKHGFWGRLVYKGKDFKEAFDTFLEGIEDTKYI